MRAKILIVANWKMNPTSFRDAKRIMGATKRLAEKYKKASFIVAPPAVYLRDLASSLRARRVTVAAQDAHFETEGAFTGSISMVQVKESGATHVLVGHAERRAAGDTDEDVRKKVNAALAAKLTPILCVGEHSRDHSGEYFSIVRGQLYEALADVEDAPKRVIIAYEPVWAIGKETAMAPHDMHEMSLFIQKALVERFGDGGHNARVLYGGSLFPESARGMAEDGCVQGFLLGRSSIDPQTLSGVLSSVYAV